ncbi:hypothetical protein [Hansschlegelia sp.]|uniref:hypothetical protein n=1 Tax=Hansschlegelia sp. TaxID=2041892 RepID=UPI002BB81D50|nr:hypothetical protein [Hansschlegelia sp.]HVI28154.1 hypothetical protein [Hansschlegelia sp.]
MPLRRTISPLAGCLTLAAAACSPSVSTDEYLKILSSDAYVVVGDMPLVAPIAALPETWPRIEPFTFEPAPSPEGELPRFEAFRKASAGPETAPRFDQLKIVIRAYGSKINAPSDALCSRMTREWSRSVCDDPANLLTQTLPPSGSFYLVDDRRLENFRNFGLGGRETMFDQLKTMDLSTGATGIVCDRTPTGRNQSCTAAKSIKGHLAAVWRFSNAATGADAEEARRQGEAIAAFALHGLARTENYPALREMIRKIREF